MPRGPHQHVDPVDIMDLPQLRGEKIRLLPLYAEIVQTNDAINWLVKRRLLKNETICAACNMNCKINNYQEGIDGKRWKCPGCEKRLSIRDGSFFTRSKLELAKIVVVLYYWSEQRLQNSIDRDLGIDLSHTTVDWYNFCREVCTEALLRNPTQIGGMELVNGQIEPKVVEIDESKFFHRKYHRGRYREGRWVFGGIERVSKKCFLVIVDRRDAATLLPLIEEWVLPGTHIMTDGWLAYQQIPNIQNGIYTHEVVIHERHFVDPNINTQRVKNMWMRAKRQLKSMFGTRFDMLETYLVEFMWRECRVNGDPLNQLILDIIDQYPV